MSLETRLERLVMRMLFDPELVDEVYQRPKRLLQSGELTQEGLEWIQQVDPRRWRADPSRSHRALEGIVLHIPLSIALTSLGGVSPQRYLEFFKSVQLHQTIQDRGLLSVAFSEWLLQETPCPWPELRVTLNALERSIAQLKSEELTSPSSRAQREARALALPPLVRLIKASQGALDLSTELSARLKTHGPHASLSNEALSSSSLLLDEQEQSASRRSVTLLVQRDESQVSVSELPPALAELLWSASQHAPLTEALSLLQSYELNSQEARELLSELVEEGLLLLT